MRARAQEPLCDLSCWAELDLSEARAWPTGEWKYEGWKPLFLHNQSNIVGARPACMLQDSSPLLLSWRTTFYQPCRMRRPRTCHKTGHYPLA